MSGGGRPRRFNIYENSDGEEEITSESDSDFSDDDWSPPPSEKDLQEDDFSSDSD